MGEIVCACVCERNKDSCYLLLLDLLEKHVRKTIRRFTLLVDLAESSKQWKR